MTDKQDLIREIQEYVAAHGGENTATHLLVQAAAAISAQAAELEAVGAGGVQPLSPQNPICTSADQAPAAINSGAVEIQWWRKRADQIELEVAKTGSREAMKCYTDMRTLLQAAAAPQAVPVDRRKAFEAWARMQPWIKDCGRSSDGDSYGHWDTQKAWLAWDAAPQAAPAPAVTAHHGSPDKTKFFAWWGPYQLPEAWMARIDLVAWHAWQAATGAVNAQPIHLAWRGALKACGVNDADRDAISEVVLSMLAEKDVDAAIDAPRLAAPQATSAQDEREAFELSQSINYPSGSQARLDNGEYLCAMTQVAWEAWQARAALAAQGGSND